MTDPKPKAMNAKEAVERFVKWPVFEQRFNHCGAMNATALSDRDWYLKLKAEAVTALATLEALVEENAALRAEVGQNKALIADLTQDMNEYHDKAEKAEAEVERLKKELEHERKI